MSTFSWPYYTLSNGRLFDEAGRRAFPRAPGFVTPAEAEIWLEHQDERGNVRALTDDVDDVVSGDREPAWTDWRDAEYWRKTRAR
jgi:hypothetical protein